MNIDIMKQAGFEKQVERVDNWQCPICAKPINPKEFRDEVSRKEFRISGLCQKCQDSIFKEV